MQSIQSTPDLNFLLLVCLRSSETERTPICWFTPETICSGPGVEQAKARSQEHNQVSWIGDRNLITWTITAASHHLRHQEAGVRSWRLDWNPGTLTLEVLTTRPHVHPSWFFWDTQTKHCAFLSFAQILGVYTLILVQVIVIVLNMSKTLPPEKWNPLSMQAFLTPRFPVSQVCLFW